MATTEAAVRRVIKTALTSEQVSAFIADAGLWVIEELSDQGYTEARLEIIERYLACALIRVRELGVKSATLKDVSETYQTDLYITDYLHRAASFDSSGKLRDHFMPPTGGGVTPVTFAVGTGFKT